MKKINEIIKNYLRSNKHFFSLIKSNLNLLIFLVVVIISQIIFAYHTFENIILSILYPIALFGFISIAYAIVYTISDKKIEQKNNNKNYISLGIIIFSIILNFLILTGQFPKNYHLNEISKPIRKFSFALLNNLGFTQINSAIIINNLTAVIIPISLLLIFSKIEIKTNFKKKNLKILFYLFLLYLPVIIFSGKSLNEIWKYLPVYLFIAAIPEEVLFRRLLQTEVIKFTSKPVSAIILASLIFGLMHLPINTKMYGDIVGLASCIGNNAFGGMFIGYLYHKTKSIETAILFHLFSGITLS